MPRTRPPEVLATRTYGHGVIRPLVRSGALERIRRGAYVVPGDERDRWAASTRAWTARAIAVADRLETDFAFSHRTAAMLHGWPVALMPHSVDVVQRTRACADSPDVVRHYRPVLPADDVDLVDGLPVTSPIVTLVDCLTSLQPRESLAVADAALATLARVDVFDRAGSQARLTAAQEVVSGQLADRGAARGIRRARAVLDVADGFSGSPGESTTRWAALAHGLRPPVCQYEIRVDGSLFFADLAWPGAGPDGRLVVAEYDGAVKYRGDAGPAVVSAEKEREDAIRSGRSEVVRFTARHLRDPGSIATTIRRAFGPEARREHHRRPALQLPPGRRQ